MTMSPDWFSDQKSDFSRPTKHRFAYFKNPDVFEEHGSRITPQGNGDN
jgi:hypothetical protein